MVTTNAFWGLFFRGVIKGIVLNLVLLGCKVCEQPVHQACEIASMVKHTYIDYKGPSATDVCWIAVNLSTNLNNWPFPGLYFGTFIRYLDPQFSATPGRFFAVWYPELGHMVWQWAFTMVWAWGHSPFSCFSFNI